MTMPDVETLVSWLAAEDAEWKEAVRLAADRLLQLCGREWQSLVPIDLNRLASTLRAEIVTTHDLKGDAFLIPHPSGFRVLVRRGMPPGRFRASVAHEIVHTLFYSPPSGGQPHRLLQQSKREEQFCFDVARLILAPMSHLKSTGILRMTAPDRMLDGLINVLKLSRPWAARVMLADYSLVRGVAGRWVHQALSWKLEYQSASASPDLKRSERQGLRRIVRDYLERGTPPHEQYSFVVKREQSGEGVFVLIAIK